MRKYQLLLLLFPLIFSSCGKQSEYSKFRGSQDSYLNSLGHFKEASGYFDQWSEKPDSWTDNDALKLTQAIKNGIDESKKVEKDYLDFLDPELDHQFRFNLVESYKIFVENQGLEFTKVQEDSINNLMNSKQDQYWAYVNPKIDAINDKMDKVDKKTFSEKLMKVFKPSKKSFWRMLIRFFIYDFLVILVFSLLIVLLLLLIGPFAAIVSKMKGQAQKIAMFPLLTILGLIQGYFWLLWSSFCAATVLFYISSPTVRYDWIYYVTGFMFVSGPIGWLSNKEKKMTKDEDERNGIRKGTFYYSLLAIIGYLTFVIWPKFLDTEFLSWFNNWVY